MHTGDVFDVTRKQDVYGKGGSYNIFAGKDGSKGLGMSSLDPEDAVPDYSALPENEMKVLDDWHSFFSYVHRPVSLSPFRYLMLGQETIQYRGACHGSARCSRTQGHRALVNATPHSTASASESPTIYTPFYPIPGLAYARSETHACI